MAGSARVASLLELNDAAGGLDAFHATPLAGAGRMYGGETAARALAAAQRTVPPGRRVHVVQASYLRAGDPALALSLQVTRLRDGRAFAFRRVDVLQLGRLIFTMTVSFHAGRNGFSHQDPMPAVPGPEALPALTVHTGGQRFWPDWIVGDSVLELRPVPGSGCSDPSRRAVWSRVASALGGDVARHECLWLYASDCTLTASIRLPHEATDRKTWLMTSLNHTVWFHRPFRADEWHLVVQRSPRAEGGRGLAQAQVFSREGTLVSTVVQEGLAAPFPYGV